MTQPTDGVRGRVFLRNADTGEMRYLLWVEQKGEDFYWGSPFPSPDMPSATFGPDEDVTIEIPKDLDDMPRAKMKTSFHRSGMMHVTSNGSGAQETRDVFVGNVTEFRKPTLFAAIMAVPAGGMPFIGNPRKKKRSARTLVIPDEHWQKRFYFDFSFSPEGTFEPWGGFGFDEGEFPQVQESVFLNKDLGLLMVIRAAPMSDEMSAWRPNQSILLRITPEAQDVIEGTESAVG